MLQIHCLVSLMVLGSTVALPCVQDGKVKVVKELKSYQVQPNCTVKYSLYYELDGLQFEQELPSPTQTTKEQASCELHMLPMLMV